MWNKELPPTKLYVYHLSNQLTNILYLREEDKDLDGLIDSTEVKQIGEAYHLTITNQQELKQASQFLPAIGHVSRHQRFRLVLRKSAQKRISQSSKQEPTEKPSAFILSNARLVDFFWWVSLGSVMTVLYQAL
jgi:hypothetical protein